MAKHFGILNVYGTTNANEKIKSFYERILKEDKYIEIIGSVIEEWSYIKDYSYAQKVSLLTFITYLIYKYIKYNDSKLDLPSHTLPENIEKIWIELFKQVKESSGSPTHRIWTHFTKLFILNNFIVADTKVKISIDSIKPIISIYDGDQDEATFIKSLIYIEMTSEIISEEVQEKQQEYMKNITPANYKRYITDVRTFLINKISNREFTDQIASLSEKPIADFLEV